MRKNILKEKIEKNEPTIGTRIVSPWPSIMEIIGLTEEMDYVEFSGEYSSFTLHDLDNLARACELENMSSMIKIDQSAKTFLAQRAIGSGFQNVLFTDIRTVADARDCVKAVRAETPETGGINPAWLRRSVGYFNECGSSAYVEAMENVVVAIMIEKKSAVENIREILSVEGIDMIQFGPSDYSMSIGCPGQRNNEEVKSAEVKAIETALEMGIVPRVEINSPEQVHKYIELGVRHFNIGMDILILFQWLKEKGSQVREIFNKELN